MKHLLRLLAVACATLGALVLSGTAMAAYTTPRLEILNPSERLGGGGPLTIRASVARTDDPTFRLLIYVPQGYVSSLVPQDGQQIGTINATINATAISAEAIVPVTGRILADTSITPADQQAAAPCLSGLTVGQIDAIYILEMSASGQTLRVPMYVTTVTQSPEADFASGRMVACLPHPSQATLGAKLVSASLTFNGIFTNPFTRGDYRWRSLWSPWSANAPFLPNGPGTVETQAVDRIPVQLAISRAVIRRGRLIVSGSLLENRAARAGARIQILVGRTAAGVRLRTTVRTNRRGVYNANLKYTARGPVWVRTRVVVPPAMQNGCALRTNPAFSCLRTTFSAYTLFNNRRVRAR